MCLVVMAARAATGATVRVVKADTARLEDATSRARDDMLTRMFVFLLLLSSSKSGVVRVAMISQKKESVMNEGEDDPPPPYLFKSKSLRCNAWNAQSAGVLCVVQRQFHLEAPAILKIRDNYIVSTWSRQSHKADNLRMLSRFNKAHPSPFTLRNLSPISHYHALTELVLRRAVPLACEYG